MSENYNFQPQQNPQGGYPQQGYQQPYPPTIDPEAVKAEKQAMTYSIIALVAGAVSLLIFGYILGGAAIGSCIASFKANKTKNIGFMVMAIIGGVLGATSIALRIMSR